MSRRVVVIAVLCLGTAAQNQLGVLVADQMAQASTARGLLGQLSAPEAAQAPRLALRLLRETPTPAEVMTWLAERAEAPAADAGIVFIGGDPNPIWLGKADPELAALAHPVRLREAIAGGPEPLTRRALPYAAIALAGSPAAVAAFVRLLDHQDPELRWRAAWALAWSARTPSAREAVPTLRALLNDPVRDVRTFAALTLSRIDPRIPGLATVALDALAAADCHDPALLRGIVHACPRLSLAECARITALLRAAGSAHRREGLALAGPNGEGLIKAAWPSLLDADYYVRTEALRTVARLGPQAAEALPKLMALAQRRDDAFVQTRRELVLAVVELGPPAVPVLEILSQDPDAAVSEKASEQLRALLRK